MYRYKGKKYSSEQVTELLVDIGAELLGGKWYFDGREYKFPHNILLDAGGVERKYSVTADLSLYIGGVTREVWGDVDPDNCDPEEMLYEAMDALELSDLDNAQWERDDFMNGYLEEL